MIGRRDVHMAVILSKAWLMTIINDLWEIEFDKVFIYIVLNILQGINVITRKNAMFVLEWQIETEQENNYNFVMMKTKIWQTSQFYSV